MIVDIGNILLGLAFLVVGGNLLLKSAISIAIRFDIPKIIIGMTVVSMATSFPELVVSLNAALKNSSMIALGNVIGSNISNIGFILSVTAMFSAIIISKNFFKYDFPVLMIVSIVFTLMLLDDNVSRIDGILLLMGFAVFIWFLIKQAKESPDEKVPEEEEMQLIPTWQTLTFLILGGIGLWGGAELLINGSVAIAEQFGLSERIIGVTIIAIGTSIPELAASLISIYNKESDISLGNIVGSNIFNILLIMGTVATISPIEFQDEKIISDAWVMTTFAFIILPLALLPKKYVIGWIKGLFIFGLFIFFIYQTIS